MKRELTLECTSFFLSSMVLSLCPKAREGKATQSPRSGLNTGTMDPLKKSSCIADLCGLCKLCHMESLLLHLSANSY
uniref:Macaca fascicularis brain cDNA, clone: QtrA-17254 n=1 Tax=Macaca fascicularis TaxID=9541 RepID=I7G9L3_MACFA|nr:unnamed protein product [Macaca fascicularis]